jgi:hypothetical protein
MQVVVIYNSKKKCLEIKGRKASSYHSSKPVVLKRSHAFEMGDVSWTNQTLVGKVDLDDIRSLEEKKSPRPKWKYQVKLARKKGKFVNLKNGKSIDQYSPRVFLEDSKIFVL